jgi:uncharacterized membrane protein
MNRTATMALVVGAIALGATAAYAAGAPQAQQARAEQAQQIPKGWNYQIENGQRVAKGSRVTNPDGSWREEVRQGNCVTIKEKSAAGEYKETRQCNH